MHLGTSGIGMKSIDLFDIRTVTACPVFNGPSSPSINMSRVALRKDHVDFVVMLPSRIESMDVPPSSSWMQVISLVSNPLRRNFRHTYPCEQVVGVAASKGCLLHPRAKASRD